MLEPLDRLRKHFERDKNPAFAWMGIAHCFELNSDFPDWVLTYLKSSTAAVLRADGLDKNKNTSEDKTFEREAERIGKALGFGRSEGETGSFEDAYKALTDEMLHEAVLTQLAAGEKEYRAYDIVAKERGFSKSTVRRAFLRFAPTKSPLV
jgi:hypothetical protein